MMVVSVSRPCATSRVVVGSRVSVSAALLLVLAGVCELAVWHRCAAQAPPLSAAERVWVAEERYCMNYLTDLPALLTIADEPYESVCSCQPPIPTTITGCIPQSVDVVPLNPAAVALDDAEGTPDAGSQSAPPPPPPPPAKPLSPAHVKAHIADPQLLRVVSIKQASFSCVDGRGYNEVLGTWGGDAGELVLALAVWERLLGRMLTPQSVQRFLRSYISLSPQQSVYYHTDAAALAFVMAAVGVDDLDITMPPPSLHDDLYAAIVLPNAVGCEHLRGLLENSAEYGVRRALVEQFMVQFHAILWDPDEPLRRKIRYYVLHGGDGPAPVPGRAKSDHHEQAFLRFEASPDCVSEHRAVVFPPFADDVSVFVSHPQAVEAKRNATAGLVTRVSRVGRGAVRVNLQKMGEEWAKITHAKVVPSALPEYIVTVA